MFAIITKAMVSVRRTGTYLVIHIFTQYTCKCIYPFYLACINKDNHANTRLELQTSKPHCTIKGCGWFHLLQKLA